MRSKEELLKLYEDYGDINQKKLAKFLNIPRSTIRSHLKKYPTKESFLNSLSIRKRKSEFSDKELQTVLNNREYCYCLGVYLGDGYISKTPRSYRMRIFLDRKYQKVVEYTKKSFSKIFPDNKISVINKKENCDIISFYSNKIIYFFPQSGRGKKHEREIKLTNWQKEILTKEENIKEFIKGLIWSDGSRFIGAGDVRYNFTNASAEIADMFFYYSNKLGLSSTRRIKKKEKEHHMNQHVISFYKRKDVKFLDNFVGSKNYK